MKKLFAISLLLAFSAAQAASENAGAQGSQQQQQEQSAKSDATNAGNTQAITVSIPAAVPRAIDRSIADINYGTQVIKNTPSVNGSPLVSSNDTCMGSASGSLNIPGVGIGLGKTYTDANCVLLKNSRELWNMGMKAAAMALMCKDTDNKEALELTGFVCPVKNNPQAVASQRTAEAPKEVPAASADPFIAARVAASK